MAKAPKNKAGRAVAKATAGSKSASGGAAGDRAAGGKAVGDAASVGPAQYLQQVRQEGRKVVWPTGREVYVTSLMVMFVLFLMGAFFFVVDFILANGVQVILGLGT